jgi:serine O-acetyltransferase
MLRRDLDAALRTEMRAPTAMNRLAFAVMRTGVHAVLVYRLAEWFSQHQYLAPLGHVVALFGTMQNGAEISPGARIGPGFAVVHSSGVVIAGGVVAGENLWIHTGVVIGHQVGGGNWGAPVIGDDVIIGTGAKLLGPIRVGDGARIGAGAVVIRDVPAGHVAVGVPARTFPAEAPAVSN